MWTIPAVHWSGRFVEYDSHSCQFFTFMFFGTCGECPGVSIEVLWWQGALNWQGWKLVHHAQGETPDPRWHPAATGSRDTKPSLVSRNAVQNFSLSFSQCSPLLGWRFSQHQVRCQLNFYAGLIASGMRIYLKLFYVYKKYVMIFHSGAKIFKV